MKTGKKNLWLIVSLSVAFVVSMFFGVYSMNSKKASAIADGTFQMEGAAIRMDGVEGLRFGAVAAADVVASVNADSNKSFGAFIAPLDWMEYLNITTTYSDSYDYYKNFKEAYAEVSTNTVQHDFNITPYKQRDDGSYELCITLKSVQYNNMSRTFFGLFCIVDNNGTPDNEADDTYEYATFSTNNQRSFAYVASAALTDTSATFTEAQKTNIYKTLQLAMYKKAGVNESTAKSNIAAGTYLEYELELNTSAVTLSAEDTYDIKASLVANSTRYPINDMVLKYTSSDTGVATVSNSGRITAVANGSATITVTYANPSAGVYYSTETVSVTVEDSVSYVAISSTENYFGSQLTCTVAQDNMQT